MIIFDSMRLKELYKSTIENSNFQHNINITVISNINFYPYLPLFLKKFFANDSISVNVFLIDYIDCMSQKEELHNSDIIVVILNFGILYPNAFNEKEIINITKDDANNKVYSLYSYIHEISESVIIWFGFEDYYNQYYYFLGNTTILSSLIDDINMHFLREMNVNDIFIDFKKLISIIGINNAYCDQTKYRWNSPYSIELIETICHEIYKQYLIYFGKTKKCLVLDCDNVLWGGTISEDGIDNIIIGSNGLGQSYQDFQRFVLSLYNHGVILAICSKNYLEDILAVFREHKGMILSEDNIAAYEVNWNNKPENICKIANCLNISLDSMVFVDDSDFEIESVKTILPEVLSIKYNYSDIFEQLSCFNLHNNADLQNVQKRNMTYKTNTKREALKRNCKSFKEFVDQLKLKIDIHEALSMELLRISDLTQRTNRYTNGQRYTVMKLKSLLSQNHIKLYSVSVSDKFADLGIVGAIAINNDCIELFSLSCRALGRGVENVMLNHIKSFAKRFIFSDTGKNKELYNLLLSEHFEPIEK